MPIIDPIVLELAIDGARLGLARDRLLAVRVASVALLVTLDLDRADLLLLAAAAGDGAITLVGPVAELTVHLSWT